MNTKTKVIAATAALASAAGVGLVLEGPASAHAVTHTMTFKTPQIADKQIGDSDVAADKNVQSGKVIGYDVTSCKINVQTHVGRCDVALSRAAGLMYAHVHVNVVTGHGAGTVTGGTRRFAGAAGTVTVAGGTVTIHWTT